MGLPSVVPAALNAWLRPHGQRVLRGFFGNIPPLPRQFIVITTIVNKINVATSMPWARGGAAAARGRTGRL